MHINLKNEYISKRMDMVNSTAKCSVLYKHIKFVFESEYYLTHQLKLVNMVQIVLIGSTGNVPNVTVESSGMNFISYSPAPTLTYWS